MSRSARYKIACLGFLLAAPAVAGTTYWITTTGADHLLERGREALGQGNWNQANRCLELLDRRGYPDHAHLLRGESWLRKARIDLQTDAAVEQPISAGQNSSQRALGELTQIRAEGPLALEAAVLGAECLVRQGERRFAVQVLDTVVARNPDHKEAHRWLAAIYIDLNSSSQAIDHLREWGRLDARNGRPYRWIGWFLSKDYGNSSGAIEAYREACRRDLEPDLRVEVIKELAEALVNGPADYQAALDTLDQCSETVAQPEILTLRAQCLWSLARQSEALPVLDAALRAKPELPQALQLRAKMFLSDGQPQAAVPLLEAALAIDVHDHISQQLLMQTYKQLGDDVRSEHQRQLLEETRSYKDQLTKLHDRALRHPWDAGVRHQLADLCLKLNRQAEAQMWRQAASACISNQSSEAAFEQSFSPPGRN